MKGRRTSSTSRVEKRLRDIVRKCEFLHEPIPNLNFAEFFQSRGISYDGEEVKVARRISWEEIRHSLPVQVGMLDVRDFCHGGVLHYIENFRDYLLPPEDLVIGRTPDVMVKDGDWCNIAKGLLEAGVCTLLPKQEIFHIKGRPLLSGMFSVSKDEFVGETEVCRLIMNLKPVNANCRSLTGDTGTLPSVHTMGAMYLHSDELLCVSSEDIRCFFYLFKLPPAWLPFLAFGKEVPRELLPPDFPAGPGYLCSRVLPMGFVNSVAVAQHIHRSVVRRAMGNFPGGLGGEAEIRRDRFFPRGDNLFRVYLDNFDQLQRVDSKLASLIQGTPTPVVQQLREAYLEGGLPRHPKKAVESSLQAEVQGAWIDGIKGTCGAKPSKVLKYVALALGLVKAGVANQRELQVVAGGLVYVAMFRRPMLSGLNAIWHAIVSRDGINRFRKARLEPGVVRELIRFIGLLPLAHMDFRSGFDGSVTASDASTTGGGLCVSKGLSPYGQAASLSQVRGDVPEEHDFNQVLGIGLFDGIAALRIALDILGLPLAGHVSVEKSEEASRVVESFFPEVIRVSSVEEVDSELVKVWAAKFSNVAVIVLGAGPPCQGVSGLNSDKKGALKDHRSVLFKHVPRIAQLLRAHFPWAQVHELVESVASMGYEDCETMSQEFDMYPWFIDSHEVSLCHRPRLYWITWELLEAEGVEIIQGSDGRLPLVGEVRLLAQVNPKDYLEPGWTIPEDRRLPTFTTARPSLVPLRRPAGLSSCSHHEKLRWQDDLHRFPPYQYRDNNCLQHRSQPPRVPNIREREAILGFPVSYTKQCMKKASHGTVAHQDCRLSLLGNTWSVPVIAWLLTNLFSVLGFGPLWSPQDIVNKLKPGLHIPRKRDHMDGLVSDYIEHLWSEGEGRAAASTFLASLQDYDPKLKGCLPASWRLMRTWTTHEVPNRAPPLTESILRAMVSFIPTIEK
eukprot:Skav216878  [mRNA]  locus=scaffold1042:446387:450699:+ [translate_table: standard]